MSVGSRKYFNCHYFKLHSCFFLKSVIYDCRFDEELLPKSSAVYVGFDPTADSLHTGNLLAIAALIHCQSHGCQPIAIVSTTVCCLF